MRRSTCCAMLSRRPPPRSLARCQRARLSVDVVAVVVVVIMGKNCTIFAIFWRKLYQNFDRKLHCLHLTFWQKLQRNFGWKKKRFRNAITSSRSWVRTPQKTSDNFLYFFFCILSFLCFFLFLFYFSHRHSAVKVSFVYRAVHKVLQALPLWWGGKQ